jgi:hypothetical protein
MLRVKSPATNEPMENHRTPAMYVKNLLQNLATDGYDKRLEERKEAGGSLDLVQQKLQLFNRVMMHMTRP